MNARYTNTKYVAQVAFLLFLTAVILGLVHYDFNSNPAESGSLSIINNSEHTQELAKEQAVAPNQDSNEEPIVQASLLNQENTTTLQWLKRPSWILQGRLIEQIDSLQTAYANGNPNAGFILGAYLSRCFKAHSNRESLDKAVEQKVNEQEHPNLIEGMIKKYEFCEGITQQQRDQHIVYFAELAEAGYSPALEVMGSIPSKLYMQYAFPERTKSNGKDKFSRDEYVARLQAFEKAKYVYLNQAAEQGSLLASFRLINENTHSPLVSDRFRSDGHNSTTLALASAIVVLHFTQDNMVYGRADFLKNRLYKDASAKEIYLGELLAEQRIKKIRQGGEAFAARQGERWAHLIY